MTAGTPRASRSATVLLAFLVGSLALFTAAAEGQGRRANALVVPEVARDQVICFALYTVHDGVLKMTAQLYPLEEGEPREVRLEVDRGEGWTEIARAPVNEDGWTAVFRIADWDDRADVPYRLAHGPAASYSGRVRKNPVDKQAVVVAGFTGNSINKNHGGDISRADIIANIEKLDPDVLFFSGDQVYDHRRHYAAWLKFGRDFGEIIRDRPTITIPDDHDVGQANLWGASGKKSNTGAGHDGGYFRDPDYVRMVERAQTSHLPDPYDPTPVQRGIGVYYTKYTWGGVSFAIIEDRKFKTGPSGLIPKQGPRPDHVLNPDYDPGTVDVPGAVLLGERQLEFLDDWGQDWRDAEMKVALSQTVLCGGAHIHGKVGGRLHADLDSNGWPQTGRNKAIDALRKCFAVHFAGDQHLATIFQHGVDEWRDGGFSFCVPSIANLYLRWWKPLEPGASREPGMGPLLGDHLDGFGNHVTCWAVANPAPGGSGGLLTTRAAGFGVLTLDKRERTITMSCWPRNVDVGDPAAQQYPGWPKTIAQTDNYGREAAGYLPTLNVAGPPDPVVQIVDEATGEWVYTLRIKGASFRPKVFKPGRYTIRVGEGENRRALTGVEAGPLDDARTLDVALSPPSAAGASRPNIIYIMADDAGYGDFGCYGQERFDTPNIDRLAAEGMRFTQHYAGSTVCAPSRCALMTGKHTGHCAVRGNRPAKPLGQSPVPGEAILVSELLKQAGYATGAFGKWGLGPPGSAGDPLEQGFDTFYGYNCQRNAHTYYPTWLFDDDRKVELDGATYSPDLIMERALAFIRAERDGPFFCYLPVTIPHAAMHVPDAYAEPFREAFPQFADTIGKYAGTETRNPIAAFAGMMTKLDEDVGRVMALLEELGIAGDTIVMFTSDNGPHREGGHDPGFFDSNGPLTGLKRSLTEGGIRVPLIVRWPGRVEAGSESDLICAQWDFLPTACALAGVPPPRDIDGISMVPTLLQEGGQPKHDYLYWEFFERGGKRAARMGRWKAIQRNLHKDADPPIRLFDLDADLGEQHDVSSSHPEVVARMRAIFGHARTPSKHWAFKAQAPSPK